MATKHATGFSQMPKMMTDEPSVILKLKKGGKVHKKEHHEEHGHHSMHHVAAKHHEGMHGHAEHGHAPKKPSMAERRKAMNPNFMKKGGMAHKAMGGAMPMGAAPMAPMGAAALGQMAPAIRAARAMQVRKALTGMKKGGHAGMEKHIEKLEKELHHHESLGMKEAHHKHGGKIHHKASGGAIDRDETKTTIEHDEKPFVKTKVVDADHADKHHGTGEIKEKNAGGYKRGGKVHHKHHFAEGGTTAQRIPADSKKSMNSGKIEMGGTIEGNEHYYEDTDMHTHTADKGGRKTGQVDMSNAGGFRHGGKAHHKMHHKAAGGAIEGNEMKFAVNNVDGTPKGKTHTKTGEVKEANAGGFKHGGHAAKKAYTTGGDVDMGQADRTLRQSSRGETRMPDNRALNKAAKQMGYEHFMDVPDSRLAEFHKLKKEHGYAKGGNVNDAGRPVAMPKKHISLPVANSLQSGTFKKGGKVKRYRDGDSVSDDSTPTNSSDMTNGAYQRWVDTETRDNENARKAILDIPSKLYQGAKSMLGIGQTSVQPRNVSSGKIGNNPPTQKKHGGRAR